jgi:hypothetical protein
LLSVLADKCGLWSVFCCSCPRFVSADDFVAVCFCSCNISNINHGLLDLNSDAICGTAAAAFVDVAAVACFVAAGAAVSPDAICGTAAAAVAAVGPDALCGTDEDEW